MELPEVKEKKKGGRPKGQGQFFGSTPWTEENFQFAATEWGLGTLAGNIAAELQRRGYSITRNAVIGKMHRMNVKQPPRGKSPKAPKSQPRKRIVVPATHKNALAWGVHRRSRVVKLPTLIDSSINVLDPNNPGISITALTPDSCRAIVRDGTFYSLATYCGENVTPGKSYCAAHCRLYFNDTALKRH